MIRNSYHKVVVWPGFNHVLNEEKTALVLLNQPLLRHFEVLWHTANICVCADGGANRLYDERPEDREKYIPTCIVGDLDSVRPEVAAHYKRWGTQIISRPSQDDHDLTKSLNFIDALKGNFSAIWILGALDGRFDHTIASISTLHQWQNKTDARLVLLNNNSMVMLLDKGEHIIHINNGLEGPTCGLLPLAGRCESVTSTGLHWNLNNDVMEMGALVSSSNLLDT
eukprot:Ihof_evm5s76 gene=Ihof_evmTU5s76